MIAFTGRGILMDIEGTLAPIAFVTDVLFLYAAEHLAGFLRRRGQEAAVCQALKQMAKDQGPADPLVLDFAQPLDRHWERIEAHVQQLMRADAKTTGLKALQGLIWAEGYENGELRSVVFPDVPPALARWSQAGIDLRIFSSGSVPAQRVFFSHTDHGNLLPVFRGLYDTTTGPKREPASYHRIAADMGLAPAEILFLSDVAGELDAARDARLVTAALARPGNAPLPRDLAHPVLGRLDEIS